MRDYFWNGLKITDVPGVSAFSLDEKEARVDERLAQLRSLGKPVLGVINVKMSFNINDELDVEDLQDKLADTRTIDATINQFKEFAALHNQDWRDIKFVATHLLSAYLTQDKDPTVFNLSRFAEVEDFILEKVRRDGRFLRIKTFAAAVPMSNIILKIYEQSARSLLESQIWFEKTQELGRWSENFFKRAKERMETLYTQSLEKIREAKSKLSDAITLPSRDILNQMHDKVIETFNNEILAKGVGEFSDLLAGYQFMLARLGHSQSDTARALFDDFSNLNLKLFIEASNYKGAGSAKGVSAVPRIPGEKVLVVKPEKNFYETLKIILGVEFQIKSYRLALDTEEKKAECAFAFFPKSKVDATNFKLAQQIAGRPIVMR